METEPLRVIIENMPKTRPWYIEGIPIFIAVIALIVSIVSLYWSRKQFRDSSRPFVWAETNFAYRNPSGQPVKQPEVIPIKVRNVPALLKYVVYRFYFSSNNRKTLLNEYIREKEPVVRYPTDSDIQYTYNWAEFPKSPKDFHETLKRYIRIEYTSLSGGKKYFFECESKYDPNDRIWRVEYQKAN